MVFSACKVESFLVVTDLYINLSVNYVDFISEVCHVTPLVQKCFRKDM